MRGDVTGRPPGTGDRSEAALGPGAGTQGRPRSFSELSLRGAERDVLHRVGLEPDEVLAPDRQRRQVTVELGDYLQMTLSGTRELFRELLRRQPLAAGRQVKFLPAETLLCMVAAYVVSLRRYGGANVDKVPSPVPELARCSRDLGRASWKDAKPGRHQGA